MYLAKKIPYIFRLLFDLWRSANTITILKKCGSSEGYCRGLRELLKGCALSFYPNR